MKRHVWITVIGIMLTLAWPFVVYLLHQRESYLLLPLAGIVLLWRFPLRTSIPACVLLGLASILFSAHVGTQLYPVLINLIMLITFASSLVYGMPVVERLARIKEPDLPEFAIKYTRNVTIVWSVFLGFNGTMSLLSVVSANTRFWFWYNGVISYILIGLVFGIEWLVRCHVKKRHS